jgi:hypothetical protein
VRERCEKAYEERGVRERRWKSVRRGWRKRARREG